MVDQSLPDNPQPPLKAHHLDLPPNVQSQPHSVQYVQSASSLTYPSPTFEVVNGFVQLILADYSFD